MELLRPPRAVGIGTASGCSIPRCSAACPSPGLWCGRAARASIGHRARGASSSSPPFAVAAGRGLRHGPRALLGPATPRRLSRASVLVRAGVHGLSPLDLAARQPDRLGRRHQHAGGGAHGGDRQRLVRPGRAAPRRSRAISASSASSTSPDAPRLVQVLFGQSAARLPRAACSCPLTWYVLAKTRFGLRLRAGGREARGGGHGRHLRHRPALLRGDHRPACSAASVGPISARLSRRASSRA